MNSFNSAVRWPLGFALLLFSMGSTGIAEESKPEKLWVYIGTYTQPEKSKGIYLLELDPATGKLTNKGLAGEVTNPSFLAIHPSRKFLYAVGEIGDFKGKKTGVVSAFAIDQDTGKLTLLNQEDSGGSGPCHNVVDKEGKNILVANYSAGSCAALPIKADGKLGEANSVIQHKGNSVDKGRQEGPHAHSINLDPANRFAFTADLGLDKVLVYRFDSAKGTITPNDPPSASVKPGAGPRHFAFHPSGKYAYVINEMGNTVTAFDYDAENGVLKEIQSITTLPKNFKGTSHTAEVQVHPSGKFLYGSNRGHNSIAIFAIDEKTGKLTAVGHQGEGIKTPRNFGIDPTGKYMLVGSQDGDKVIQFKIDQKTGELEPAGTLDVFMPVCIKFMPAPK